MGTKTIKTQCVHCKVKYEYKFVLQSNFLGFSVSEKSKEEAAKHCPNPNCLSKRKLNPLSVFD